MPKYTSLDPFKLLVLDRRRNAGFPSATGTSQPPCNSDGTSDDTNLLGKSFIASVLRVQGLVITFGGSEFGTCSTSLATSPIPSQITKIPGGAEIRWLTSIRMRSPLESNGSIKFPSTMIIRRSSGRARNSCQIKGSAKNQNRLICLILRSTSRTPLQHGHRFPESRHSPWAAPASLSVCVEGFSGTAFAVEPSHT